MRTYELINKLWLLLHQFVCRQIDSNFFFVSLFLSIFYGFIYAFAPCHFQCLHSIECDAFVVKCLSNISPSILYLSNRLAMTTANEITIECGESERSRKRDQRIFKRIVGKCNGISSMFPFISLTFRLSFFYSHILIHYLFVTAVELFDKSVPSCVCYCLFFALFTQKMSMFSDKRFDYVTCDAWKPQTHTVIHIVLNSLFLWLTTGCNTKNATETSTQSSSKAIVTSFVCDERATKSVFIQKSMKLIELKMWIKKDLCFSISISKFCMNRTLLWYNELLFLIIHAIR